MGLTPGKAAALRRLDEEREAEQVRQLGNRRVRNSITPERIEKAMQEFLSGLRPMRRESESLVAERRAAFRVECNRLRLRCGVESHFDDADLFNLDPRLPAEYRQLAEILVGLLDRNAQLAIIGTRGRGKTWLASGVVHAFCDLGRPAIYRRARDLFNELSLADWADKDRIRAKYLQPDLLVLDEVQVRDADRAWQDNELTDLIDRRYSRDRSTVLLANLHIDALWKSLGTSIQRRVAETGGVWSTEGWPLIHQLLNSSKGDN